MRLKCPPSHRTRNCYETGVANLPRYAPLSLSLILSPRRFQSNILLRIHRQSTSQAKNRKATVNEYMSWRDPPTTAAVADALTAAVVPLAPRTPRPPRPPRSGRLGVTAARSLPAAPSQKQRRDLPMCIPRRVLRTQQLSLDGRWRKQRVEMEVYDARHASILRAMCNMGGSVTALCKARARS